MAFSALIHKGCLAVLHFAMRHVTRLPKVGGGTVFVIAFIAILHKSDQIICFATLASYSDQVSS